MSLNYCKNLLTDRKPSPGYEDIVEEKKVLHEIRMRERLDNDKDKLDRSLFEDTIESVAKKHKDKYKFIIQGGKSLRDAAFSLFSLIWEKEKIPEEWYDSLLIQLHKSKSKHCLDNYRFIHLKGDWQRLFSQMVTLAAKENLINHMSKFQIATKPGHRATEHIFVILSIIAHYEVEGKLLLISMIDLRKYFDSESAYDCWSEIYANQVKGKIYRLLFELNKKARIKVKTPVGVSDSSETNPLVSQGTSEGAIVSAVNLDNGMAEYFHSKSKTEDEEEDKETSVDGKNKRIK